MHLSGRACASIKAHISGLGKKNYPDVEELNALDFVLMFVPIESALIAALQRDPSLPEYALQSPRCTAFTGQFPGHGAHGGLCLAGT